VFGQAQKYGGIKLVNGIATLWITRSSTAIHVNIINVKKTAQIRFHSKRQHTTFVSQTK
jgi:hypothetical protein